MEGRWEDHHELVLPTLDYWKKANWMIEVQTHEKKALNFAMVVSISKNVYLMENIAQKHF